MGALSEVGDIHTIWVDTEGRVILSPESIEQIVRALVEGNKAEFEAGYTERSRMTVEDLHSLGLYGEPCDKEGCKGWQMVRDVGHGKRIVVTY